MLLFAGSLLGDGSEALAWSARRNGPLLRPSFATQADAEAATPRRRGCGRC